MLSDINILIYWQNTECLLEASKEVCLDVNAEKNK